MSENIISRTSFEEEFGNDPDHHNDTQFENGGISGRHAYRASSGVRHYPLAPPSSAPKQATEAPQPQAEHEQLRFAA